MVLYAVFYYGTDMKDITYSCACQMQTDIVLYMFHVSHANKEETFQIKLKASSTPI